MAAALGLSAGVALLALTLVLIGLSSLRLWRVRGRSLTDDEPADLEAGGCHGGPVTADRLGTLAGQLGECNACVEIALEDVALGHDFTLPIRGRACKSLHMATGRVGA